MPDRRTQLAEAALEVVAREGLRGLTHRAVDAAAEVPVGTTSNYFRSRAALLAAVSVRMAERDLELVRALGGGAPETLDQFSDGLAGTVLTLVHDHADLTRVRLTLSLDQPDTVTEPHARMTADVERVLAALGVEDAQARAVAVADYCDGLMLHALTARRGRPLERSAVAAAIRRLVGSG